LAISFGYFLGDLKRGSFGINRYRAVSGLFDRVLKTGAGHCRDPWSTSMAGRFRDA
jgi:hypothetical protein